MSAIHISFDSYRKHFLSGFKKLSDSPSNLKEAKFRFDEYGDQIIKYITSEDLPMPVTIGLNGEWGSGKTTFVRIIQEKIEQLGQNSTSNTITIKYAEFNAWNAEKNNIAVSLWYTIEKALCPNPTQENKLKPIATLFIDIALRKTIGMQYDDVKKHLEKYSKTNYREELDHVSEILNNKRLIIFIDDLDRCDASNILEVLEIIKNLLDIKNIIFFITVDIKQIERAWEIRYRQDVKKIESREYVDKLFPIIFTLPPKSDTDIEEYVNSLVLFRSTESESTKRYEDSMSRLHGHLAQSMGSNPRKIKRILNTVFFIIQNVNNYSFAHRDLILQFERYFAFVIAWVCIAIYHPKIAEIIKIDPSSLVYTSLLLSMCDNFSDFNKSYEARPQDNNDEWRIPPALTRNDQEQFTFPNDFLAIHTDDVLKTIISEDNSAFKLLKQISKFMESHRQWYKHPNLSTQENIQQHYSQYTKMLTDIIEKGGLTGI